MMDLPQGPLEPLYDADPRKIGTFQRLGRLAVGAMCIAYLAETVPGLVAVKITRKLRGQIRNGQAFSLASLSR